LRKQEKAMTDTVVIQLSSSIPVTRAAHLEPESESSREGVIRIRTAGTSLTDLEAAGFAGIRVIADVHGAFVAFDRAVCEAERYNRFVIQLGDTIDRGEYSPLCVEVMLDLERRGAGQMLLGNHEYKFARFVRFGLNAASSRVATLIQFEDYSPELLDRFVARIEEGPLWIRAGSWLFVHAAFDPRMLDDSGGEVEAELAGIALFGAGRGRAARRPAAIQAWVDRIPKGLTVVVGHTITPSRQIEYRQGAAGGRAIFLETGGWQDPNGTLATLDISFDAALQPAS
jgi:hypothetical protein